MADGTAASLQRNGIKAKEISGVTSSPCSVSAITSSVRNRPGSRAPLAGQWGHCNGSVVLT